MTTRVVVDKDYSGGVTSQSGFDLLARVDAGTVDSTP